ncbi:MAG: alpha/beta hydrolase [Rhodospirillaceae bacterium]|jgi:pimeloyl-ACP methyl ester carboxylesterase
MSKSSAETLPTIFNSPDLWEHKFIEADGYKTSYAEAGDPDAEPLILVHGGACEIGMGFSRWYPNIIPLAEKFHVFAIDELGSGDTDPPRDLPLLGNVHSRGDHVIAFMDALNLGRKWHLVGQSQGGWIVTYIAITRPDLVEKLVLIDSASTSGSAIRHEDKGEEQYIDVNRQKVKVDGSGWLPYFDKVFEPNSKMPKAGLLDTKKSFKEYVSVFHENKNAVTDEWIDHLWSYKEKWMPIYLSHRGKDYWKDKALNGHYAQFEVNGIQIREHVHKITVPTLVLWGRNSVKGMDPGFEVYKNLPNAEMYVFNNANHFLWTDKPEKFNSLVTWFLERDM